MTEADSPGTRSRIEVIEPPYIEPYQIPASMMTAVVVSRKYVIGRSRAIVAAEPSPGRIPITTPSKTPVKQNSKLSGCNETENPRARFENSSIQRNSRALRRDRDVFDQPRAQALAQILHSVFRIHLHR